MNAEPRPIYADDDCDARAIRALWLAVLAAAVDDARRDPAQADWFFTRDAAAVADLAGIAPEWLRRIAQVNGFNPEGKKLR